jgi:hypothetical protein
MDEAEAIAWNKIFSPKPICGTCGHQLTRSWYGWLHWDEDEGWDGCPCVGADGECIPRDY